MDEGTWVGALLAPEELTVEQAVAAVLTFTDHLPDDITKADMRGLLKQIVAAVEYASAPRT